MKNHIIDAIQSHLNSYCCPGQAEPFIPSSTRVSVQIEGGMCRVIFTDDPRVLSGLSGQQDALIGSLKTAFPEQEFQFLFNAHQAGGGKQAAAPRKPEKFHLPQIKKILAVTSGKGGVGKSLVAVNLALSLKAQGMKVGLLDLDIYGPSLPTMLNVFDEPQKEKGLLKPLTVHGMPVLSMGLMIPPEKAVIWRGPLIQKAVQQMLVETAWPELDVLILDTPPGTGDVHLTLAQHVPLTAALVVSTPQKLAVIDAQKSIEMFQTLEVPVLGLVENMAPLICPHCASEVPLFPESGIEALSQTQTLPILARIPFDSVIQESADSGAPIALANGTIGSEVFQQLAEKVHKTLF